MQLNSGDDTSKGGAGQSEDGEKELHFECLAWLEKLEVEAAETHISSVLPGYVNSDDSSLGISHLRESGRLKIYSSLEEACRSATIVQEQGPGNLDFKRSIWPKIESSSPTNAHFWSSYSGIAASLQNQDMIDKTRLLVGHPFNPPHILPLLEIVPSPTTNPEKVDFAQRSFAGLSSGHYPHELEHTAGHGGIGIK
ncbi:hypothetical protein LY76DRAFT_639622 [Colletotrichum caudatum]|nr:hypothetical protein LY76DRAFT_639622 [Colletotrichum caudatum]